MLRKFMLKFMKQEIRLSTLDVNKCLTKELFFKTLTSNTIFSQSVYLRNVPESRGPLNLTSQVLTVGINQAFGKLRPRGENLEVGKGRAPSPKCRKPSSESPNNTGVCGYEGRLIWPPNRRIPLE